MYIPGFISIFLFLSCCWERFSVSYVCAVNSSWKREWNKNISFTFLFFCFLFTIFDVLLRAFLYFLLIVIPFIILSLIVFTLPSLFYLHFPVFLYSLFNITLEISIAAFRLDAIFTVFVRRFSSSPSLLSLSSSRNTRRSSIYIWIWGHRERERERDAVGRRCRPRAPCRCVSTGRSTEFLPVEPNRKFNVGWPAALTKEKDAIEKKI